MVLYSVDVQLVATIYESTEAKAIAAVKALSTDVDMVEIRFDAFGGRDPEPFRNVTTKPLILTNRGGDPIDADFGLIDVEYGRKVKDPQRTVLSFHDFERMPDLGPLIDAMAAFGCAHTKIAVTPKTLADNEKIIAAIRPGLTLIGMGERGLYSRILAPFFGSELFFAGNAAPGQLSLERAQAIYGDRNIKRPAKIFAIAGNPAGQSMSPPTHNPLFRNKGVSAAYTIASFESFDEIAAAFEQGRIAGLSVTAPFKEKAFAFAKKIGAGIRRNAEEAGSVNTLVRTKSGVIADNTDVTGFERLLPNARRAAVVGAGGTSRAALVALRRKGIDAVVYNRTPRDGTRPLSELPSFDGDLVIDTLPPGVQVAMPNGVKIIAAAYDRGGLALFQEQALPQNELFLEAFR